MLRVKSINIPGEIVPRQMPQNTFDEKSALVQVTWATVDHDFCRHMSPLGRNYLNYYYKAPCQESPLNPNIKLSLHFETKWSLTWNFHRAVHQQVQHNMAAMKSSHNITSIFILKFHNKSKAVIYTYQ